MHSWMASLVRWSGLEYKLTPRGTLGAKQTPCEWHRTSSVAPSWLLGRSRLIGWSVFLRVRGYDKVLRHDLYSLVRGTAFMQVNVCGR
jgi:hypothetical protein